MKRKVKLIKLKLTVCSLRTNMNLHSIKYILKSRLKVITSKENPQSIGNASTVWVTFENSLKIA